MAKGLLSSLNLVWILIISGCATTGFRLDTQDRSLSDLRSSVVQTIGQPRKVSKEQMDFWSEYYPRNKKDSKFNAETARERLTTLVSIKGDRRPYVVFVEVIIELRSDGSYEEIGVDESLSRTVGVQIEKRLNESRDQRNTIDAFRAF